MHVADFVTVLRFGPDVLRLPFVSFPGWQDLDANRILVRNSAILKAYLGLSTRGFISDGCKVAWNAVSSFASSKDDRPSNPEYQNGLTEYALSMLPMENSDNINGELMQDPRYYSLSLQIPKFPTINSKL